MAEYSPMIMQYLDVKKQYPGTLLFYRVGDFYEMFFSDAQTASRELELVLTSKDCGNNQKAPMCGIPYHAVDPYIAKLVSKGYKVAVCDQTEDPALAKGLVRRAVTRVHTPGTEIEPGTLDESRNNYLGCVFASDKKAGICFADVSTGKTYARQVEGGKTEDLIIDEIAKYLPAELIINTSVGSYSKLSEYLSRKLVLVTDPEPDEFFDLKKCAEKCISQFGGSQFSEKLEGKDDCVRAVGASLDYLEEVQKSSLENISEIEIYEEDKFMFLNASARRDLELVQTVRKREKKGSLLWVLDKTGSPMGKRLLREWVSQPLVNPARITERLNAVSELFDDTQTRIGLMTVLKSLNDIDRITARIVYKTANPKELRALSQTLGKMDEIKKLSSGFSSRILKEINSDIDLFGDVINLIDSSVAEDPPALLREGNVIRKGFNSELDELREIVSGGRGYLSELERKEQEKTGIKKLKIGYNKIFGYYIEVLNSYKELVPDNYIRKQTLVNSERFITPELKELESKVLGAQQRISSLESEIFRQVRDKVADCRPRFSRTSLAVAKLDALCSLAQTAVENGYVCPDVDLSDEIIIENGRHPVVEKYLDDQPFVPNDTYLDSGENRTLIITGPNMAGKSTYMRQTALIVIMAQIGSFVPATKAHIGVADAVFTRVGASDDLSAGKSTFMTEMSEVADILSAATKKSLIILDEIGRGTSTYDGMAIAKAVLEYVNDKRKLGAKTMFATHYHELTSLENELDGVKNYNTSVKKHGDDITFLRRIARGPADGSYGIEVAKLAGIPGSIVKRSKQILNEIIKSGVQPIPAKEYIGKNNSEESGQISFASSSETEVAEEIKSLDIETLTPIQALTKLYELQSKLRRQE